MPGFASAAAPSTDNISGAEQIGALPFVGAGTISEATTEPGEPQFCTHHYAWHTIWYSFAPSADVVLQADMTGSSFYYHYLAV
jgi:hypothetical protein